MPKDGKGNKEEKFFIHKFNTAGSPFITTLIDACKRAKEEAGKYNVDVKLLRYGGEEIDFLKILGKEM